jgi:hypothetical protein
MQCSYTVSLKVLVMLYFVVVFVVVVAFQAVLNLFVMREKYKMKTAKS